MSRMQVFLHFSIVIHADIKFLPECVSAYFAGPSDYHYAKLSQVVMTATAGLMAGQQIFRQDESSAGYAIKQPKQRDICRTNEV